MVLVISVILLKGDLPYTKVFLPLLDYWKKIDGEKLKKAT